MKRFLSLFVPIIILFLSCTVNIGANPDYCKKHGKYNKKRENSEKHFKKGKDYYKESFNLENIEIDFEKTPLLNKKWTYAKLIIYGEKYLAEKKTKR